MALTCFLLLPFLTLIAGRSARPVRLAPLQRAPSLVRLLRIGVITASTAAATATGKPAAINQVAKPSKLILAPVPPPRQQQPAGQLVTLVVALGIAAVVHTAIKAPVPRVAPVALTPAGRAELDEADGNERDVGGAPAHAARRALIPLLAALMRAHDGVQLNGLARKEATAGRAALHLPIGAGPIHVTKGVGALPTRVVRRQALREEAAIARRAPAVRNAPAVASAKQVARSPCLLPSGATSADVP